MLKQAFLSLAKFFNFSIPLNPFKEFTLSLFRKKMLGQVVIPDTLCLGVWYWLILKLWIVVILWDNLEMVIILN